MKTLSSNALIIQSFVSNIHNEAKNPRKSLYFIGNKIYSYGPHFIIAEKELIHRNAFVTNKTYSHTTTRQTNAVRVALIKAGYKIYPLR